MLQSAIPNTYLRDFMQACNTKLEYFIDSETLLGENKIHHIGDIDAVFDLNGSEEFKTFAIKINPFKRMVLFYHDKVMSFDTIHPLDNVDYRPYKHDFPAFVEFFLSDAAAKPELNRKNSHAMYDNGIVKVNYMIEFDSFLSDLKEIPEFATETVNYMLKAWQDVANYQELYDEATKAKVAEVFADDIRTYGYEF
jgi:hypothetical protein